MLSCHYLRKPVNQTQPPKWPPSSSPSAVSSKVPTHRHLNLTPSIHAQPTNHPCQPVSVLLINAIAVLSEDRFLARSTSPSIQLQPSRPRTHTLSRPLQNSLTNNTNTVGWGNAAQNEPSFGGGAQDGASVKAKTINLINSVRTLMRSEFPPVLPDRTGQAHPEAMEY